MMTIELPPHSSAIPSSELIALMCALAQTIHPCRSAMSAYRLTMAAWLPSTSRRMSVEHGVLGDASADDGTKTDAMRPFPRFRPRSDRAPLRCQPTPGTKPE